MASLIGDRIRARIGAETILGSLVVLALLILIGLPLGSVILQAFVPGLFYGERTFGGLDNLMELFRRRLWRVSLTNSLMLASGTALIGTALGAGLAYLRSQYHFRGAATLDGAAWALLIMPSFVIAQGWVLFAARGGLAETLLGTSLIRDVMMTPFGLILIMSLKNYPFAYLAVRAALKWDVSGYAHAARLCGASPSRVLWTVRLPLLLPAIVAGAVLVFVDTVGDFGLPAALATTYRFPTLTYSIYTAINQAPIRFDLAGVLSFYLVLILMAAVMFHFWVVRRSFFDFLTASAREPERTHSRRGWIFSLVTGGFLCLAFVIPLGTSFLVSIMKSLSGGLALDNLTLQHFAETLAPGSRMRESLINSFTIAGLAGIGSIILGLACAYLLTFSRFALARLIDVTCTATLAVPGVILGVGYIFVWNQKWLDSLGLSLYGEPAILVLAAIAGSIPVTVRLLLGAIAQIPGSFLDAAAMQGASLMRRIRTILAPLMIGAVVSATLAAFGSSVFDLAVTSILRPPGFEVIPVTINRQFQQGDFGLSTAGTLLAAAITVAIILGLQTLIAKLYHPGATAQAQGNTGPDAVAARH